MSTLTITEYGLDFIMGVSFDMSSNTSLQFRFEKPDGSILDVIATLGTSAINTTAGLFDANEWASYTFASGDLDQSGAWKAQLRYTDASSFLLSTIANFNVTDNAL